MKKLSELYEVESDVLIKGIKINSKEIEEGDLFICVSGFSADRHDFIDEAIERGASAIVVSKDIKKDIPTIKVKNTDEELPLLCKRFYDNPEEKLKIIGITGTDGKTSSAIIIQELLGKDNCGYIGTNGLIYKDVCKKIVNTTPDADRIYQYLKEIVESGCSYVVMEVSSEALYHKRVDTLKFDICAFTNITEDHLNIHKTIENYKESKKRLFSLLKKDGVSILNIDDDNYEYIKKACKDKTISYGEKEDADFKIENINAKEEGITFEVKTKEERYKIESPLHGSYNTYNLTLGMIVANLLGKENCLKRIKDINCIPGRTEIIDFGQNYTVILDYAHTYNGIYNIIKNMKQEPHNRMLVLTGAAGGREHEKRNKIGKMILENAEYTIFTMDDPRYESVDEIIDELVKDTTKTNYERVLDREKAIFKIFDLAEENDMVLILGKGRDNYMAIEDKRIEYCDYDVICKYFKNKENRQKDSQQ